MTIIQCTRFLLAATCALGVALSVHSASAAGNPNQLEADVVGGYASDRILVRFSSELIASVDARTASAKNVRAKGSALTVTKTLLRQINPDLDAKLDQLGVGDIRRSITSSFSDPAAAARFGLDRTYVFTLPPGSDAPAAVEAIASFVDQVELAELVVIGGVAEELFIPNDALFDFQWGMHNTGQVVNFISGTPDADVDAPEAWALHTGNLGTVTVAVVDSGVDPHVEFQDRMVPGQNILDPEDPDSTSDLCPHGTHVAGIIAAQGDNGIGVSGMSWGAKIMPVRVLSGCFGNSDDAAAGIVWAANNGADIINVSLQFCTGSVALESAVNYANTLGKLVISAAGNGRTCGLGVTAPARYANSMAVSATNHRDLLAYFSNFGPEVDVSAPGEVIKSTWVNNSYRDLNGTSMAAPHVSGLAALIKSFVPELSHTEIRNIITTTADDLGDAGWDEKFGYGRINAYQALLAAGPARILSSDPPDGAIDARQPSDPDGSNPAGLQWIDLTFSGEVFDLTSADFSITQEGGVASAPSVLALSVITPTVVQVIFTQPLEVAAWTTITHIDTGSSVRVGVLPGDVNGDGVAAANDILHIIDVLNGARDPLPEWSGDVDRSGKTAAADILRVIDLLGGAEVYDPYIGIRLP